MSNIYTKTGDSGTTSLVGGSRVPKTDVRVEAYGTVDELGAHIALLDGMLKSSGIEIFHDELLTVAKDLMRIEAAIAVDDDSAHCVTEFDNDNVVWLEELIDNISATLQPAGGFIVPCGAMPVGECHVCRTVCRRAERRVIQATELHHVSHTVLAYLNRLSDYLFVLARKIAEITRSEEILWVP